MGTTLTGQTQSSTYDALLKITDNGPVGGTLKTVTDGLGNDTALQVSTAGIASTGTLTVTGATTLAALAAAATTVTTLFASGIVKTSSVGTDGFSVDAAAGSTRAFAVKTSTALRWSWGATSTAESGSNVGSDFFLGAYNDAGTLLNNALIISRANGKAGFVGIENTPLGAATPSTGAFTTLSASGAVSGAGVTALFASPPAIGGTAAAAGSFTTLAASGTLGVSGTLTGVAANFSGQVQALSFNQTSASRFKENVTNLQNGLTLSRALRPVEYNMIGDKEATVGFIAEEVYRVVPSLVSRDNRGEIAGLNYSRLVAVNTAAIQELADRITAIERAID